MNSSPLKGADVPELLKVNEWGGIALLFPEGEPFEIVAISKDTKSIGLVRPRDKGGYGWNDCEAFIYRQVDNGKGIFVIRLKKFSPKERDFGLISNDTWKRIQATVADEIPMIKESNKNGTGTAQNREVAEIEHSGGISLEFDGKESRRLIISIDERMVRIESPNLNEEIIWPKVKSLNYKSSSSDKGMLSLLLVDELKGTDKGKVEFGVIDVKTWARITLILNDQLKTIKE